MNRKGITAIVDAAVFIVLISLAVTLLSQYSEDSEEHDSRLAETCDGLMAAELRTDDLGYWSLPGQMKFTDIWGISLMFGDRKGTEFTERCFDAIYPWADTYGFQVAYGDYSEISGKTGDGWRESVTRTYPLIFGGELTLTVYLYG